MLVRVAIQSGAEGDLQAVVATGVDRFVGMAKFVEQYIFLYSEEWRIAKTEKSCPNVMLFNVREMAKNGGGLGQISYLNRPTALFARDIESIH